MNIDPFTEDSKIDLIYPAQQTCFSIDSNGSIINGYIEIAQGKGPHKTIILLHGFPGTEKNADLAQIFRRAGYNVVIFSYRGSWGSKGNYSFKNSLEDVINIIKFIETKGDDYRCNVDQIILIGFSFGGFLALYASSLVKKIKRVASISGWLLNVCKEIMKKDEIHAHVINELINNSINPLNGTTSDLLKQEIENIDSWDFEKRYFILIDKDICLISGLKDSVVPAEYYHFPIINELEKINPDIKLTQTTFYDASHSYSDHRLKLAKYLLDWLEK